MDFLFIPFGLQAVAMFFDEFYFHRKRGLPLWERIGHPFDTLTVLSCYLFIFYAAPTDANLKIYIALCAFSSLFITKDEFVHTERCEARENWLHAVLFVLHPVTFLAAGLIWKQNTYPEFLLVQPIVTFLFMLYQILYWSPLWNKKNQINLK
ncbi:MAG: hypothetical protein H7Z71_11835 [Moraxellaceae bacterium]|nr:hypothetical protein [Pseudobdellovibrionaceae bacterium]